jgi:hypothetical protein
MNAFFCHLGLFLCFTGINNHLSFVISYSGYTGEKYIYAFSAREIKRYLDIYIDMHPNE